MSENQPVRRVLQIFVIVGIIGAMLWIVGFLGKPGITPFLLALTDGAVNAGTWNDDLENWRRAFNEEKPTGVSVVRSKYWRSNHFTLEFAYYFEVKASPEWRDAFLQKHGFQLVPLNEARTFGSSRSSDEDPRWFAPYPARFYEVWKWPNGVEGLWIEKSTGHLFFYAEQF